MVIEDTPILSVVEHIPGQRLNLNDDEIYDPSFWIPHLPLNFPELSKKNDHIYQFQIQDTIKLDPTGTLSTDYNANGEFNVQFVEHSVEKGAKWTFEILIHQPKAKVQGVIRARNEKNALKLGIFLYSLDTSDIKYAEFGQDAIFFAIRLYIRKFLQKFKI